MQTSQITKTLDDLLAIHKGHPSNYVSIDCPTCLYNCAHHVQRRDCDSERARAILSCVPLQTINDAIREVSTALDNHELVTAFPSGGLNV